MEIQAIDPVFHSACVIPDSFDLMTAGPLQKLKRWILDGGPIRGFWAGVVLAPEAGKRITDMITGKMKPEDKPLRPTRHAAGIMLEGSSFFRGH